MKALLIFSLILAFATLAGALLGNDQIVLAGSIGLVMALVGIAVLAPEEGASE